VETIDSDECNASVLDVTSVEEEIRVIWCMRRKQKNITEGRVGLALISTKVVKLKFSDLHKGAAEVSIIMRCGAASQGDWRPTFRENNAVSWTLEPLRMTPPCCIATLRTNHPLIRLHISK
jgi:hypothetical protein